MQYIWMIMLAIAYLIWTWYSIKDYIYCCKEYEHPLTHIEDYTRIHIVAHILGVFVGSLVYWLGIIVH